MRTRARLPWASSVHQRLGLVLLLLPLAGPSPSPARVGFPQADDWLYVLQPAGPADLASIGATAFDVAVIDYSSDGGPDGELTPQEIAALRATGKTVLAYLSIGEAESYRWYWDPSWNDDPPPDPDAPPWLGPFNPAFPDNYKVRYWQPAWQELLFGTPAGPEASYLDRIVDQGFDGVYLDIIDAYWFWSEVSPELTRDEARLEMIALVEALAIYARDIRGATGFRVVPQNGLDVVWNDDELLDGAGSGYLAAIDAVGVEDLYYDELTAQPPEDTTYREAVLDDYQAAGAVVLLVDYVWDESDPGGLENVDRYNDFHQRGGAGGYVAYAAVSDRDLDEILTVTADGQYLVSQPRDGLIFSDGFESGDTMGWFGP